MCAPNVEVVTGGACSGKTRALVARVHGLVAAGAVPADVLVVTPSADGALELAARLAADLGPGRSPRVVSWRRLAHELAGSPRVLGATELSLLHADLRAMGFSAEDISHAQREVASAVQGGLEPSCETPTASACVAHEPGGADGANLSCAMQNACLTAMLDALRSRNAVVPASLVAHAFARRDAADGGWPEVAHVLVDDADAVPPHVLKLVSRLARTSLFLAGDASRVCAPRDSAADPHGFLAFADADGVRILPDTSRRLNAASSQAVKWGDAAEEAAGVAALVDRALSGAVVGEGPVVLVAPNRPWARRISQALANAGIEVRDTAFASPLACDPRDPKGSVALRCFAALGLLADADDAASWRTWCSLGYADLASGAWKNLQAYAASKGEGVVQALRDVCGEVDAGRVPFAGARQLAARVHEAEALFAACKATPRGFRLLEAIDPLRTPGFRQLFPLSGDDLVALDAAGLFAVAQRGVFEPGLAMAPAEAYDAALREQALPLMDKRAYICRSDALVGVHPRLVVILGANEGLTDPEHLAYVLSTSADELVVSHIQRMPAEIARRLGASFHRTRLEAGEPVALLRPSSALEALGAEAPATMSGQQYCASVLGLRP